MLHLIYGRAGSGKSSCLQNICAEASRNNPEQPLYYIVPEQFSFETERTLLRLLGPVAMQKIHVLSFSRLADEVFRQYGGNAGRRLDESGRSIFMCLALEQVKDHLKMYRRKAENSDMIHMLLSVSQELKFCMVSPEKLQETSLSLSNGTLKHKIQELSLILGAYDALVAESCIDPLDDLSRIPEFLLRHAFFQNALVLIDSFNAFTVQEYTILRIILQQAKNVYITLCTDTPQDTENGVGLFSLVQRTGTHLKQIARENGIPVASPTILKSSLRFLGEELRALEENIYRPTKNVFSGKVKSAIYRAADIYDEAEFVAAMIRELVMEKGYHYSDIAIIARNPAPYAAVLEETMESRDIPFFMDDPRPVDAEPLMRLVFSALQAVRYGWRTEDILMLMKTSLTSLQEEQVAQIENYVYMWSVSGKAWLSAWEMHPRGFESKFTEEDKQLLENLETYRKYIAEPLQMLETSLRSGNGEKCSEAIFRLLENWQVSLQLRQISGRLEDAGRTDLAEKQIRSWDFLMDILDQCALVMKDFLPGIGRFCEIFHMAVSAGTLSSIPQCLDQVTIGGADRIRLKAPKVVFLLGAKQGEFPASVVSGGVLNGLERQELIRLGLPLNETLEGTAVQERFLAYTAVSSPSDMLFISYPGSSGQDANNQPSSIVLEAEAILPGIQHLSAESLPTLFFANAENPAFRAAARSWRKGTVEAETLEACFRAKVEYAPRLDALEHVAERLPQSFRSPQLAQKLFGQNMNLSATKIETYHLCRFQYFCRYGLDIKERRPATIDALEYGSLMHYLFEMAFQKTGTEKIRSMNIEELEICIRKWMNVYAEEKLGGLAGKSARFLWLMERTVHSAGMIVAHIAEELSQSSFVPVDYELPVGGDGIPALILPLPDGGNARIEGKIDRVDLFEQDGVKYLRVVDYKTGKKDFRLSDVIYGINMQMLIYLAALVENGATRYGGKIDPAGILYMPATDPRILAERNLSAEEIQKKAAKSLRMKGLLVDDPVLLSAMEKSGEGNYIPVTIKNGAPSRRESVVTRQEMESILRHVQKSVSQMAEELHQGHVEAIPLSGEYDACAWCPYRSVCGYEDGDAQREMVKQDRAAVLTALCRGENE